MDNKMTQAPLNRAKKDKFVMVFNLPDGLRTLNDVFSNYDSYRNPSADTVQAFMRDVPTPDISIPAVSVPFAGGNLKVSSHACDDFPPLQFNITIDNNYRNYMALFSWLMSLRHSTEGTFDANNQYKTQSFSEYQIDISVFALDEYNVPVVEYRYLKAFPTSLSSIKYSYVEDSDDMDITCALTLAFSQFDIQPAKKGSI